MGTLTEMLRQKLLEACSRGLGSEELAMIAELSEPEIVIIKDTFKEWLKTVGLPDYWSAGRIGAQFSTTESLRQLLIALVDEP